MSYTVKTELARMDVEQHLPTVNKSEQRELLTLYTYRRLGHVDTVARGLSALIRAARTKKSRDALMAQADILEVVGHPEFIVS